MANDKKSLKLSDVIDLYFENYMTLANSFFLFGFISSPTVIEKKLIEKSFNNELRKINIDIDLALLLKRIDSEILEYSENKLKILLGILESKKTEVIDTIFMVKDSAFYENTKRIKIGLENEKAKTFFNLNFIAYGFHAENRLFTIENLLQLTTLRFGAEYPQITKRFKNISDFSNNVHIELKPQDLDTSSDVQHSFPFKNNFDHIKEDDIIKHFTINLVNKGHLTELELIAFLKAAFEKMTPPIHLFKFKNLKTQNKIKIVFYNYYKDVAGKPYGKQKQYAELLGKYFNGFNTNSIIDNFSRK